MRDKPENIRKASVHAAVREVLDGYDRSHGTRSFCEYPVRLEGFHVVPVLQFDKARFEEYPCMLAPVEFREYKATGGFLESVVRELLLEAQRALWSPEPGRFIDVLEDDNEAVFRKAGDSFCSVLLLAAKDVLFQGTFRQLNRIAALQYEGSAGSGTLLVGPADHPAFELKLKFARPVPLHESRWARKVLEMSKSDLCCVCTGTAGIAGLGTLRDSDADGVFAVEFAGHYKWHLRHKGRVLLQSSYGVPRLPHSTIKEATFKSALRRIFAERGAGDEDGLWQAVDAATHQRHGTMIVVADDAASERLRLRNQATPVTPVPLSPDLVRGVSGIDGAILADQHGICHAVGVILDGMATEDGDPARGARFNSALRYFNAKTGVPALIVVVSEDGDVDMIPPLRAQIARSAIERKIDRLKGCTIDNYAKARNWLRDNAFYLTVEQCNVVNAEITRIEGVPVEPMELRISTPPFLPDPAMNESYYLPEATEKPSSDP